MKKRVKKNMNLIIGTVLLIIVFIVIIILFILNLKNTFFDNYGYIRYGKGDLYNFCPNEDNQMNCYITSFDNMNIDKENLKYYIDNKIPIRLKGEFKTINNNEHYCEISQTGCGKLEIIYAKKIEKLYD
ncbi:hypothetical protein COU57_04770 [Candidatus Pacearchaeota archaeon CG10_big_fil_rev_8_21_14_0_10_32_14]|nr:MAG: hypothetical protein COU57_04770 [Candidatus Pacearchaeota archaeon CG10_big_fil_rev_8_21_14_0_10_32_14]